MTTEEWNLDGFAPYKHEEAEAEHEEASKVGDRDFVKLKEGANVFRILPAKPGEPSPFRFAHTHYVDVPKLKGTVSVACPLKNQWEGGPQPCPICAKIDQLRRTGNKHDAAIADEMFAKRKWFANVIDRKEPQKGVQLLSVGPKIMKQISAIRAADPDDDFTHPIDGVDLVITRTGTGQTDTEYSVSLRGRKSSPIANTQAEAQALLDSRHDLDRYAIPQTTAEILSRLRGERRGRDRDDPALPEEKQMELPPAAPRQKVRTAEDDAIDVEAHETPQDVESTSDGCDW